MYINRWKSDCLHMCMPGPLDLVPRLLYHQLLVIEHELNTSRAFKES